jgi:thymidine kinase
MFSGKTEELLRRLKRARIARQPVQVFKPRLDDRYDARKIVSHSAASMEAEVVADVGELTRAIKIETRVVGIDEVQFFGAPVVPLLERVAAGGVRVIVAGLDQDYTGRPFEPMPELLAVAEYVTKVLAICVECGAPAGRSQRLVGSAERVVVGAADAYEARCRQCHVPRPQAKSGSLFRP